MNKLYYVLLAFFTLSMFSCGSNKQASEHSGKLEILFLGHKGRHHNSSKYAPILSSALFTKGINISYTDDPEDLNPEMLQNYDGLILYANHDEITPSQEKALFDFVESGKGFIPIHCASFCFRNSEKFVQLVGAQFKSHKTGTFKASISNNEHEVIKGFDEFETWDETYVHAFHNEDRTILMERIEDDHREPWTWVREHGKGRVFYTAYGHDERTWSQPAFHDLIERGIKWAVGEKATGRLADISFPELQYSEAEIPNYEKRDPAPQFQAPLSPEESQKLIQVPPGFELQLFASEPDIINPIAMAWDERGRLWVIETVDYPNSVREEDGIGDDKIKILEDTNGDGKADKVTVFAENLNIPTSLTFANGGVIVSQAPHFLFLKDTDGDDVADVREIISTGWGTYDTHAGPSNLKYGLDNMLWGTVGYAGFKGKIGEKDMQFGQGVYRFTPDGKNLEFLSRTSNNTWGLGFNENFDIFISTANNTHSAYYSIADKYFVKLPGMAGKGIKKIDGHYEIHPVTANVRQVDVHGGFTAAAGHNFYTARSFPKDYWNKAAFVCEPTGHLLHKAILEKDGAGFVEKDGRNMMASIDEWFSPVHAEVGPDGALWVADWYNFIIQHNPTPVGFKNGKGNAYENPLRDKEKGRIYRVSYKGAKPYKPVKLDVKKPKTLIEGLKNDNMLWRTHAQRLIVESKLTDLLPELYKLIHNQEVDEIGLNAPAIHALWTLHGLGALDGSNAKALEVAIGALKHPSPGVRKAAVQTIPRTVEVIKAMRSAGLTTDKDKNTRLAAFIALAETSSNNEIGEMLYKASKLSMNYEDEWISQAIFAAASMHKQGFLDAFTKNNEEEVFEIGKGSLTQQIMYRASFEIYPLERGHLSGPAAPEVSNKEIIITGNVRKRRDNDLEGMMAIQGGEDNGYALYIQDKRLKFLVKQKGDKYLIQSPMAVPDSFRVEARLRKNGEISISIDGKQVSKGKAKGVFEQNIDHGLRVGHASPNADKLEDFGGWFGFSGRFENASLELVSGDRAKEELGAPDQVVHMKVIEHEMKYDIESFTVKAGTVVEIILENTDFMQHNLVITDIGALKKVGQEADRIARDPKAIEMNYVPNMPEVLFATALVDPDSKVTLRFRVPDKPGDYPFVCTFPGHWSIMNGVMKVVPGLTASR